MHACFSGSDLTICFGLASRDYTRDGNTFYTLFQKEVATDMLGLMQLK